MVQRPEFAVDQSSWKSGRLCAPLPRVSVDFIRARYAGDASSSPSYQPSFEQGFTRQGKGRGYMCTMKALHVGLVADPAAPTRMAHRIKDLDSPESEQQGAWDIEVVSRPFTTGSEDVYTALARLG